METESTILSIHQRLLQLRDAAIISEGNSRLGYDCVTDALVALYNECSAVTSLSKTRDVSRFLKTYKPAMEELQNLRLREEDFNTVGVIGRGHFGEVRVVREKSTKDVFAMKVMKKAHILQQADAAFFLEERDIMAYGQSNWLTKLHYAFQNDHSLYLVMDFHPGGDLFTIMERNNGGMSEQEARFYISEIIAGLHDLHKLGFAHRDVKPDNVLIARSGHIKLVDFGSASRLDKQGNVVDMALPVGTPEYISPEVLTSLDNKMVYGACCDWWSVGIILYELLLDVTPFEGDSTVQTYANIMNYEKSLTFPDSELSNDAKHVIKSLLVSSNERIGYNELLTHPFFNNTDWENLDKSIPPIVPALSGPNDLSNFENFEDVDDSSDIPPPSSVKNSLRTFTGKELPFIGFSFMRWSDTTDASSSTTSNRPNVFTDLSNMTFDIKRTLESTQTDLKSSQERNSKLEKECVIYQSQLEDLQRKLDVERRDRRMSDSKSLQLLSDIREQSKVAQTLREAQSKETNSKVEVAMVQLEEERLAAVKKAQRAREDLKKKTSELNATITKANDLHTKLSKLKENSRKETECLQSRLSKVTDSSRARIEDLQKENFQIQDKVIKLEKEIKTLRTENTKQENKLNSIKLSNTMSTSTNDELHKMKVQMSELTSEKKSVEQKLQEALKSIDEISSKCEQVTVHLKSSKAEIQRVNKEKRSLVNACDNLTAERDRTSETLRKQEKKIELLSNSNEFLESKVKKLEILSHQQDTSSDETVSALQKHNDHLELEREVLQGKLKEANDAVEKATALGASDQRKQQKIIELEKEIVSLKESLSETTSSALRNGEKVTELSNMRKTLEGEVTELNWRLTAQQEKAKQDILRAEALTKQMEDKYTELLCKVDKMEESREERPSNSEEALLQQISILISEKDKAHSNERRANKTLAEIKKQFESQELSVALMKRSVSSLEEELADASAVIKEKSTSYQTISEEKTVIEQDLETAEEKVDSLTKQLNLVKEGRQVLENQSSDLRSRLEELTSSSNSEVTMLKDELESQRQLSRQFSEKLAELQKEFGLKELYSKETERSLEVERALTAKLYDDLNSIGREHGKLKASYLKVTKKLQSQEMELEEASREKKRALIEKATIEETMDQERNRLQTQLAQFNKLVEITPRVKATGAKTKGLKLGRKKRDPVKEMDEWNKMRKLTREKGGVLANDSLSINSPGSQSNFSSEQVSIGCGSIPTLPLVINTELFKTPVSKSTDQATPSASIASTSASSVVKNRPKRTASTDASVYSTMTHNIPHRWTKSSRLHKARSCASCGGPIKHTEKFSKCSCCSVACHLACTESMPNTCGLPQSLALQLTTMSPPKKTKHDDTSFSSTDTATGGPLCSKENLMAKIPKRLSIDLMRCQVSSSTPNPAVCSSPITVNQALSLPSGMVAMNNASNTTELSITSSMLEGSGDSMDEDDLV